MTAMPDTQVKTIFTTLLIIALFRTAGASAFPLSVEETDAVGGIIRSSEHLNAPTIIVGRVDDLKHTRDDNLVFWGTPLAVHVSTASVNVLQVINGRRQERVEIRDIPDSGVMALQGLKPKKDLFLFSKRCRRRGV